MCAARPPPDGQLAWSDGSHASAPSDWRGSRRRGLRRIPRISDPEEVDARVVEALPDQLSHGGVTHAGLSGAPRAGDDQIRSGRERGRDLLDIGRTPNHLAGGDRLIGREEVAAAQVHRLRSPSRRDCCCTSSRAAIARPASPTLSRVLAAHAGMIPTGGATTRLGDGLRWARSSNAGQTSHLARRSMGPPPPSASRRLSECRGPAILVAGI